MIRRDASFSGTHPSVSVAEICRWKRGTITLVQDAVATEEPLEIQLVYGTAEHRKVKSISITMRTPGNDDELAVGFLMAEGVVRDATQIISIVSASAAKTVPPNGVDARQVTLPAGLRSQVIRVELSPEVEVSMSTLERNFYTTSSCGVCGKASLLALRTICPLPRGDNFTIQSDILSTLPQQLQAVQAAFKETCMLLRYSLRMASSIPYAKM